MLQNYLVLRIYFRQFLHIHSSASQPQFLRARKAAATQSPEEEEEEEEKREEEMRSGGGAKGGVGDNLDRFPASLQQQVGW